MRIKSCLLLRVLLPAALVAPAAMGSTDDTPSNTASPWEYSLAAAAARVSESDLDSGGRTGMTSYHLRGAADRSVGSSMVLGINMNYDTYHYDFSENEGFAALEPWDRRSRLGVTGSLRERTRYGWSYGVRPFVTWSSESGELEPDAMSYGLAMAVLAGTSKDRRLGVGASVSRDLDDSVDIAPVIILDWAIDENWTIGNPRETHFMVPAGLEVGYRSGKTWRFAVGGVYQSSEFRLDDRGLAPGGIGETSGILSFVRVTRQWPFGFTVNAFVGAIFNGELTVEDAGGAKVVSDKYDTAPVAAVSVEGNF